MAFNLETILAYTGAYVAVVDSTHQTLYRNRKGSEEAIEADPGVARAVDLGLAERNGFGPLEINISSEGKNVGYCVSGRYAPGDMMVITAVPVRAGTQSDKMRYIADMSHEIRTPVNAIAGFSRLLAETDDVAKRKRYMEQIDSNSRLLLQLVEDVLDLAKSKDGNLKFNPRETDLNSLLHTIDASVRFRVQPRTMLNCVVGAAQCRFLIDPERLSQVLINMLTNAVKFTAKGSITFGYEIWSESIYFFVKDTGIGIAPDKRELLFNRFYKQNENDEGSGLGLSICKEIVEKMGGEIGVESAGIGKGSLFWFTVPGIPVGAAPVDEPAPTPDKRSFPAARDKKNILVAEDNESNWLLVSSMLEDDYNLLHAWNGREAVEMYEENKPDLILMDINMPYMDGYEATKRIRQMSDNVPVIAVTAYAFASDRARIMENGFNSYVSKPIKFDRLAGEIKRLL